MKVQRIATTLALVILPLGLIEHVAQANTSDVSFAEKHKRDAQEREKFNKLFRRSPQEKRSIDNTKITPSLPNSLTILHNFNSDTQSGACPKGGLTLGRDGYLYGTTSGCGFLDGTIFKITSNGLFKTLFKFNGNNGSVPTAKLTLGAGQNLYGSTEEGGSSGDGSIFKISTSGVFDNLFSFNFNNGPTQPQGALVLGKDGNWYGTSVYGGKGNNCFGTCGTIFKFVPGGRLQTVINFNDTNGQSPYAGLALYTDGTLYGTTYGEADFGNAADKYGTVFKFNPKTGKLTTLVRFKKSNKEPIQPQTALTYNPNDRYFYGTTTRGGLYGGGTLFKMTPAGSLKVVYNFRKALI
ncbi:MAG: choice-of-anchor tandem repeat GloVer-containing protein, partial [Thermosynechococcaceae cyanobacterium]